VRDREGRIQALTPLDALRSQTWRLLLCTLAVFAAGVVVFVLVYDARHGRSTYGWVLGPSGTSDVVAVVAVTPHGAAAAHAVRAGDRIDLRQLSFANRATIFGDSVPGRAIDVPIERGGHSVRTVIVPTLRALRWDIWLAYLILAWTAIFACVIAARRPNLLDARFLSLVLSCYVLSIAVTFVRTPFPAFDVVVYAFGSSGVFGAIQLSALVAFTALFGRPLSRARRVLNAAAYAAVAIACLSVAMEQVAIATLWFDPIGLSAGVWRVVFTDGARILVLVGGAAAIAASRGSERQRVAWGVVSIGLLLTLFIAKDVLRSLAPDIAASVPVNAAVNIASVIVPIGLTYSVLSRRLLDIGFALNRAVVYSSVSVVVIGLFMTVENFLGGWLTTVSHAESLAVSVAIALAIGFSIRWIHGHIDRFIDVLFFHKRHRGQEALLRFAHEAAFVTDRDVLLSRAVDEVAGHTEAQSVAILLRDAAGTYVCAARIGPPVSDAGENDAAVLSMRASGNAVDLHGRDGALQGEYAFPMIARGTLIGTLVCGVKRGAEPYAPDEREALRTVAHGVGLALDALAYDQEGLDATMSTLPEQLAALRAEIRELREALQQRG
jgi:GAF domain-containing protein